MKKMMNNEAADSFLSGARKVFAPLYPYYASMFLEQSGITSGVCLDLGCGGGDLGLAVAKQSGHSLILLDESEKMTEACREHAAEEGVADRTMVLEADVHHLPLADNSVNLIISRGSVWFWKDLPRAFADIYRVLSPGGHTFIGGGLGSPEIRANISREMSKRNPEWRKNGTPSQRPGSSPQCHEEHLCAAGIQRYRIIRDDPGHWIEILK